MKQEIEQYQGLERDQAFVRRFDDRLWSYCQTRHKQAWKGKRGIPQGVRHEGEEGWWFPSAWVSDFIDGHGGNLRTPVRVREKDIARADRALARFHKGFNADRIRLDECRSWGLPEGTMFYAHGRVVYPDGSEETIDEIRMRKGRYQGFRPMDEQANLEAMLKMLHDKADAKPSAELLKNRLTKEWGEAA